MPRLTATNWTARLPDRALEPLSALSSQLKLTVGSPPYWYYRAKGSKPITVSGRTVEPVITSYLGDYREARYVEEYGRGEIQDLLAELNADDVFLDVGANIGIHSLFGAQVARETIAVEPHPVNSALLLLNAGHNEGEMTPIQCALSDSEGYVDISGPRGGLLADGSAGVSDLDLPAKLGSGDLSNTVSVRAERGDELLDLGDLPQPTVVKIDVEGVEAQVIDGLEETLSSDDCRTVYCEIHLDHVSREDITNRLEAAGFGDHTVLDDRGHTVFVKSVKG